MTDTVTIYHNPDCGTSRKVLALLREKYIEPRIVEYMKHPLKAAELEGLLKAMPMTARELLRTKGSLYDELKLAEGNHTEAELIEIMIKHPQLMNRPIVTTKKGTKLCRPVETVLELL